MPGELSKSSAGGGIRTHDHRVMSPASCHCSTPVSHEDTGGMGEVRFCSIWGPGDLVGRFERSAISGKRRLTSPARLPGRTVGEEGHHASTWEYNASPLFRCSGGRKNARSLRPGMGVTWGSTLHMGVTWGRVAAGDCSPAAPADPDVQVSRIRFLK
jgi:hypothetical protein